MFPKLALLVKAFEISIIDCVELPMVKLNDVAPNDADSINVPPFASNSPEPDRFDDVTVDEPLVASIVPFNVNPELVPPKVPPAIFTTPAIEVLLSVTDAPDPMLRVVLADVTSLPVARDAFAARVIVPNWRLVPPLPVALRVMSESINNVAVALSTIKPPSELAIFAAYSTVYVAPVALISA